MEYFFSPQIQGDRKRQARTTALHFVNRRGDSSWLRMPGYEVIPHGRSQ